MMIYDQFTYYDMDDRYEQSTRRGYSLSWLCNEETFHELLGTRHNEQFGIDVGRDLNPFELC
jgi:hypothetical protein